MMLFAVAGKLQSLSTLIVWKSKIKLIQFKQTRGRVNVRFYLSKLFLQLHPFIEHNVWGAVDEVLPCTFYVIERGS